MFLNSYAPQIGHNLISTIILKNIEVTKLIFMQKYIIIFSIWMEENKLYVEDPRTEINIQKGSLK